jgi:MFS transporter, DHA1 family, inner membrane transport protein
MNLKYLFTAVMFLIGTDTFIVSPLLPTLRSEFGIGADTSGWFVSAYAMGYAITAIFAGPMTERMDRKKVLAAGLTGFAVFTALCGTAQGFGSLFLYRLLAGCFAAVAGPQVWASIPQTVPSHLILKTMGWATAGLSLAQVLGIPLGSTLARESWRYPFFTVGLLTLPVIWWILTALPPIRPANAGTERQSVAASYRGLFGRREARYAFSAHFCYFIGTFGSFTYIGNWMADEFLLDVAQIGWLMIVYGAGNMSGSMLGSRLVDRWGRKSALTFSLLLIGIGFVAAPHLHRLWAVSMVLFCTSFAGGQSFPLIMSTLQSIDSKMRGTISSLANSVMYMGTTAGSALGGWLYVRYSGFWPVGVMVMAGMLAGLVLFLRSRLIKATETSALPPSSTVTRSANG